METVLRTKKIRSNSICNIDRRKDLKEPEETHSQKTNQDIIININQNYIQPIVMTTIIFCSIDGPLSILKLTDRYGTSIAKLLPSIIVTGNWSLKASIVHKTSIMKENL